MSCLPACYPTTATPTSYRRAAPRWRVVPLSALLVILLFLISGCALSPRTVRVDLLLPDSGWAGFPDDEAGGAWHVTVAGEGFRAEHVVPLGATGGSAPIELPVDPVILRARYCRNDGICVESAAARFPDDAVPALTGTPRVALAWQAGQLAGLLTRSVSQGLAPNFLNWRRANERISDLCAESADGTVYLDETRFLQDLASNDFSIYSIRAADREELDPTPSSLLGVLQSRTWGLSLDEDPETHALPIGRTRWAMLSAEDWVPVELEVDDRGHWWLRPAQ